MKWLLPIEIIRKSLHGLATAEQNVDNDDA
jgi:hypothetical protein